MSTSTDREPCRLCGRQPKIVGGNCWKCSHGGHDMVAEIIYGPNNDPSGTGWDAHMLVWDAVYAAREKKGERVMTAPICPVCGREMVMLRYDQQWVCWHGRGIGGGSQDGGFVGPYSDPDGSKVSAQIAAMEQRIRDAHPHTGADGETACCDWWRTGTCGECAWKGDKCGTVKYHDYETDKPVNIVEYRCDNALCLRNTVRNTTPACPAGVRR